MTTMSGEKVLVSVIMPVYNAGGFLKSAIESILSQSLQEIELILVDDGSTDGSAVLCDGFAQVDSRVVVIHQKNGGICNARNTALKIARGKYVAFSDHDDEYLPGLLEDTFKRAEQDNADIVKFCKKEYIISDGIIVRTRETKLTNLTINRNQIADSYLTLLNKKILDCVWDSLIRRDLIIKNGVLFDESFKAGGEDIDFITRLLKYVNVLSLINNTYYLHYIREGFSTSAKFNPVKLITIKQLAERITEGAKSLGIDLYEKKAEYIYQMTFTLLNSPATLLSKEGCQMTKKEKYHYLSGLRKEPYLPDWFFKQSPFCIAGISKRYALSYFFFKYGLYSAILFMINFRKRELKLKKQIKGII